MVESSRSGSAPKSRQGDRARDAGDKPQTQPVPEPGRPDGEPHDGLPRQDASEERLPPERLAAILRRLQEGFYDQEDVRGTIAQRVLAEIGSGPEE